MDVTSVDELIFGMRHRVILPALADEEASARASTAPGTQASAEDHIAARQVDAVLMNAGFKCSAELLAALAGLRHEVVIDLGVQVIGWARELAGDHVRHNAYFIDFPANVPGTLEFWLDCIRDAVANNQLAEAAAGSVVDLLSLPKYGHYQHSYEEMLARHDELIPVLSDRVTLLHLGRSVAEEAGILYGELAGSAVPLSGQALDALRFLAAYHGGASVTGKAGTVAGIEASEIKIRESKAIVNAARVRNGLAPAADTPTDILRAAAELSGGDVTLTRPTRFRSLPRAQRRILLSALDAAAAGKLADVARHAEQWKRLPGGLHVNPRGSVTPVDGDGNLLRFFTYWRQASRRTDFDLSALITDEEFGSQAWLSYTSLRTEGGEHSGDITDAPEGATEFVNIHLDQMGRRYVIPQVFVFSGEGFDDVAENFFGFMTLGEGQRGAPFEPRTVRMRSALTGDGRTALPLVFYRGEDGRWHAKWLHLYPSGRRAAWGGGVRVEENRLTTSLLTKSMMERDYLRVGYLISLLRHKATEAANAIEAAGDGPVTYIGVEENNRAPFAPPMRRRDIQ